MAEREQELELLTVAEAAAIFRVTPQSIRNWIEWGKLPALRVGRRFLVRREHIQELLDHAQADDGAHATVNNSSSCSRSATQNKPNDN